MTYPKQYYGGYYMNGYTVERGSGIPIDEKSYTLNVKGKGSVKTDPDTAFVTLGVVTEDKELAVAQRENTLRVTKVLNALYALEIPKEDVETVFYGIQPQYDYIDGRQVFRGYQVTHNLQITVRDLGKVGEVIDTAAAEGANTVSSVTFSVMHPDVYYQKALNMAVEDAVEKAVAVGKSIGVIVEKIPLRIREETAVSVPMYERGAAVSPGMATPIMSGTVEISAVVDAVFSYGIY